MKGKEVARKNQTDDEDEEEEKGHDEDDDEHHEDDLPRSAIHLERLALCGAEGPWELDECCFDVTQRPGTPEALEIAWILVVYAARRSKLERRWAWRAGFEEKNAGLELARGRESASRGRRLSLKSRSELLPSLRWGIYQCSEVPTEYDILLVENYTNAL